MLCTEFITLILKAMCNTKIHIFFTCLSYVVTKRSKKVKKLRILLEKCLDCILIGQHLNGLKYFDLVHFEMSVH